MGVGVAAPTSRQVKLPERVRMDMAAAHPGCFSMIDQIRQSPQSFDLQGKWAPWCFAR
jgi:hypothetical protein